MAPVWAGFPKGMGYYPAFGVRPAQPQYLASNPPISNFKTGVMRVRSALHAPEDV